MANKITVKISNHPETGVPRIVVFEGIQYLFYSMESADLVWLEYPAKLDENNEWVPVISSIITPRKIITPISNSNKVTQEGVTITLDYITSITEINEGENEDMYNLRVSEAYESSLTTGIPEFDFWISIINWDTTIERGGILLEQFKRFNRL